MARFLWFTALIVSRSHRCPGDEGSEKHQPMPCYSVPAPVPLKGASLQVSPSTFANGIGAIVTPRLQMYASSGHRDGQRPARIERRLSLAGSAKPARPASTAIQSGRLFTRSQPHQDCETRHRGSDRCQEDA
jgi:hypothetical protein